MSSPIAQFHGFTEQEAADRIRRLYGQGWSIPQLATTFMIAASEVQKIVESKAVQP
jgi:hypothetical protein